MKLSPSVWLFVPVVGLALAHASDARACGGCFVPPEESTQVTGHRMILSISKSATTLYDQIEYAGDPSSFAWVLPTKGQVEVGLSSDAMFAFLESDTQTNVFPPPLDCPSPPPGCYGAAEDGFGSSASGTSGSGGAGAGGVTVVAQEVVGPYETVQLSASDPAALTDWLASHGYKLPDDIAPVVGAYVLEGFNFLAMKLVPGQQVTAMRPVRVTSTGASTTLPLRMVAAGTGATTKVTLFVLGEGRYEASNFQNFAIDPEQLIWDWDTSSSNLAELKQAGFDAQKGLTFLSEAASPFAEDKLTYTLGQVVQFNPTVSGYGDAQGTGAKDEYDQDVAHLFGTIDMSSAWLTRLHGELPRAALAKDLVVGASMSQTPVSPNYQAKHMTGKVPACPVYPPCDSSNSGAGGSSGFLGGGTAQGTPTTTPKDFTPSCATGHGPGSSSPALGLGLLVALALFRRKSSPR